VRARRCCPRGSSGRGPAFAGSGPESRRISCDFGGSGTAAPRRCDAQADHGGSLRWRFSGRARAPDGDSRRVPPRRCTQCSYRRGTARPASRTHATRRRSSPRRTHFAVKPSAPAAWPGSARGWRVHPFCEQQLSSAQMGLSTCRRAPACDPFEAERHRPRRQ
jgi:hypothetical protein